MELDKRSDEKTEVTDLSVAKAQLPDTIEELSQFVFIGREKLMALKAAIRACRKSEVIADKLRQMKEEEQLLAENVLIAEMRIGELLEEVPKSNKWNQNPTDGKLTKAKDLGITHPERYQILSKNPDKVEEAIEEAKALDRAVTRQDVINKVSHDRQKEKARAIRQAEEEHKAFQMDSHSGIINLADAKADKQNRQVLANAYGEDLHKMLKQIETLGATENAKLLEFATNTPEDDRIDYAKRVSYATKILCHIGEVLVNGKS